MNDRQKDGRVDILDRTIRYSVRVVKLFRALEKDGVGRVIGRQVLRAGTSIGANVHEAQAAQTRSDFIAKMYIGYKEARESVYWMRVLREAGVISGARLKPLADETDELVRILSSILLSAKQAAGARRRSAAA